MAICILNGPNLNMLGKREEGIYGNTSLEDALLPCKNLCKQHNIAFVAFQNNSEGEIVNFLHNNYGKFTHIIANLGAYTHTSVAIRDALLSIQQNGVPHIIELHISNVFRREKFRHKSLISDISLGVISGLGVQGYLFATQFAINGV